MTVKYTFIRNSDNARMMIADIDNLICEFHGITPDSDRCNIIYESTVMAGINSSFHEGVTNEKNVEETIARINALSSKEDSDGDSKFIEGLRKFLYKDYHMDTWRGGR